MSECVRDDLSVPGEATAPGASARTVQSRSTLTRAVAGRPDMHHRALFLGAMPLPLLLVARDVDGQRSLAGYALVVAAIAMNAFGTVHFYAGLVGRLGGWLSPANLVAAAMIAMAIGALVWVRRLSNDEGG